MRHDMVFIIFLIEIEKAIMRPQLKFDKKMIFPPQDLNNHPEEVKVGVLPMSYADPSENIHFGFHKIWGEGSLKQWLDGRYFFFGGGW